MEIKLRESLTLIGIKILKDDKNYRFNKDL